MCKEHQLNATKSHNKHATPHIRRVHKPQLKILRETRYLKGEILSIFMHVERHEILPGRVEHIN